MNAAKIIVYFSLVFPVFCLIIVMVYKNINLSKEILFLIIVFPIFIIVTVLIINPSVLDNSKFTNNKKTLNNSNDVVGETKIDNSN